MQMPFDPIRHVNNYYAQFKHFILMIKPMNPKRITSCKHEEVGRKWGDMKEHTQSTYLLEAFIKGKVEALSEDNIFLRTEPRGERLCSIFQI